MTIAVAFPGTMAYFGWFFTFQFSQFSQFSQEMWWW